MYEVFYYHERLRKWIKACNCSTEQAAKDQVRILERLWNQPAKYIEK